MRTVFSSHAEVCHVWASQSQEHGRAGNIYFRNAVIYSYGEHFPMARIDGTTAYITTDSYSVSTATHLGHATSAVLHMELIYVPDIFCRDHAANTSYLLERIVQLVGKQKRARKYDYTVDIRRAAHQHNAYCTIHDLPHVEFDTSDDVEAIAAQAGVAYKADKERIAKLEAAAERKRKREERKRRIANEQQLIDWLNGEPVRAVHLGDDLLRVHGDEIQTSQGARVPLVPAKRLWTCFALAHREGVNYRPEELYVGSRKPRLGDCRAGRSLNHRSKRPSGRLPVMLVLPPDPHRRLPLP